MKIAFLTDPLAQFKTYKDSTFAMMREAHRRGYEVYAFGPEDMALDAGQVIAPSWFSAIFLRLCTAIKGFY